MSKQIEKDLKKTIKDVIMSGYYYQTIRIFHEKGLTDKKGNYLNKDFTESKTT